MFCHKCGTQIAEGAGFCHKCGTKMADDKAVQPPIVSQPPVATPSGTTINQGSISSNAPSQGGSGGQPSLIDQILLRRKKKHIIVAILGLLGVFVVVQICLMNMATPEMKSERDAIFLEDGTRITHEEYLDNKVPQDILDTEEFQQEKEEANWGYHALTPDQIGDLRGWDLPQDIWNSLFGEDHTGDDNYNYAVDIGRGVKAPMYEVLAHRMASLDTSEDAVSAS